MAALGQSDARIHRRSAVLSTIPRGVRGFQGGTRKHVLSILYHGCTAVTILQTVDHIVEVASQHPSYGLRLWDGVPMLLHEIEPRYGVASAELQVYRQYGNGSLLAISIFWAIKLSAVV